MGLLDTFTGGFDSGVGKFGSAISQALGSVPESVGSGGSGGRGTDSAPSHNLVEDPVFTGLRDIGSYVPILGPAISTVGAFGNYALTGEQSSPENATSRAKEVAENQEYVADPWAIAMPTVDDVRSSMDDEQFDWYQKQFSPAMESLVTELAAGPIGSVLARGASRSAMKAAETGAKAIDEGVKASTRIANNTGDDMALAALKNPALTATARQNLNAPIKNAQMLGKGFGEVIPRLLRPLLDETDGMLDIGGLAYTSANQGGDDNTPDKVYGIPVDELNKMYEYQIYNKAMEDKAYRDAFVNKYGDTFNDFAAYGNLGDDLDYNSNRRDVTRDIFGLNDDGLNDLEIQGLKDIYFENGTINDEMTNDEMLDAILNYHWGADNIIDPNQWINNADYEAAHALMGPDLADQYWRYWVDNGYLGLDETGNAFSGLGDWDKLDMDDLAAAINTGNLINLADRYGYVPTDADMEKISDVWGKAGDQSRFTWLPEGSDTKEMGGRTYSSYDWNPGSNTYSSQELLNALYNAQLYKDYSGLNPYYGFGNPLVDSNMTDAAAAALERASNGKKKIGRG